MKKSTLKDPEGQPPNKKTAAIGKQTLEGRGLRGIIKIDEKLDYKQILKEERLKKWNK